MPLFASGAGQYGSFGGAARTKAMSAPKTAGNSKLMAAESISSVANLARQKTQAFIAEGKKLAQGASGKSRINIKA